MGSSRSVVAPCPSNRALELRQKPEAALSRDVGLVPPLRVMILTAEESPTVNDTIRSRARGIMRKMNLDRFLFLVASASSALGCMSRDGAGASDVDASTPPMCPVACVYQYREITTCNEFSPQTDMGDWRANCLDNHSCDQGYAMVDYQDPAIPCVGSTQYQYVHDYIGSCDDWMNAGGFFLPGDAGPLELNGTVCQVDGDCASKNCVSADNVNFVCADVCNAGLCSDGLICIGGYCVPACMRQ